MPEIIVEFDRATQGLGPLQEAAYRMIGLATCALETAGDRYVCRLQLNDTDKAETPDGDNLRRRFLDLVTDENLRDKVSRETAGIRNVILALAFGALAQDGSAKPKA